MAPTTGGTNFESAGLRHYGKAARKFEPCLCLPVDYDGALLKVIPQRWCAVRLFLEDFLWIKNQMCS
jgi:hypothetical protein